MKKFVAAGWENGVKYIPWNGKVYFRGEVVKRYEREKKGWKLVWSSPLRSDQPMKNL
jgi:hypothetical protein